MISQTPILKKKQIVSEAKIIFKELVIGSFRINNTYKNQWFLTQQKEIIRFKYVELINDEVQIYGTEIKKKKPFYNVPIDSTYLDIYWTDGVESTKTRAFKVAEITNKLFAMFDKSNIVFFPLLHLNQ